MEDGEAEHLLRRQADVGLPESARDEIMESGLGILARCTPPDEGEDSQETGLVVGYVQSGKTLSFTTVAALACDKPLPTSHRSLWYEEESLQPNCEASRERSGPRATCGTLDHFRGTDPKPGSPPATQESLGEVGTT